MNDNLNFSSIFSNLPVVMGKVPVFQQYTIFDTQKVHDTLLLDIVVACMISSGNKMLQDRPRNIVALPIGSERQERKRDTNFCLMAVTKN